MARLSYSRNRIINRFNSMRTLSYRNIGVIRLKKKRSFENAMKTRSKNTSHCLQTLNDCNENSF